MKKRPTTANKQGGRIRERDRVIKGQWPVKRPFKSKDEIKEYFAHPRITCLLCGKKFHVLAKHLSFVHGLSSDQYRSKYGIPWTYGLASPSASNAYARALKRRIANGDKTLHTAQPGEVRNKGVKSKHRQKCPALKKEDYSKLAEMNTKVHIREDGTIWTDGRKDRRKEPKTIECVNCKKMFTRKSALARQDICPSCAKTRRLDREKKT